jgi:hypothetical protein
MHVPEFFHPLLGSPDVEIVERACQNALCAVSSPTERAAADSLRAFGRLARCAASELA